MNERKVEVRNCENCTMAGKCHYQETHKDLLDGLKCRAHQRKR